MTWLPIPIHHLISIAGLVLVVSFSLVIAHQRKPSRWMLLPVIVGFAMVLFAVFAPMKANTPSQDRAKVVQQVQRDAIERESNADLPPFVAGRSLPDFDEHVESTIAHDAARAERYLQSEIKE